MVAYKRFCKFCDLEIELSDRTGKWLPYSITTGQIHECLERGK